jgi:type IV secretory pathway component VirB8
VTVQLGEANEHPHDERNAGAATILDELATTVDSVDDQTLLAYAQLLEGYQDHEEKNEMFRLVGFQSCAATAIEFVQGFISRRTGSRWSSI